MIESIVRDVMVSKGAVRAYCCRFPHAWLVFAQAPRGYVMCGYLNLATADALGDIAAVVSGVASIEELLVKPVVRVSAAAAARGIAVGISGAVALEQMF